MSRDQKQFVPPERPRQRSAPPVCQDVSISQSPSQARHCRHVLGVNVCRRYSEFNECEWRGG